MLNFFGESVEFFIKKRFVMETVHLLLSYILDLLNNGFMVFEPYQGSVSMDEKEYSAMQGIIHAIGWTLIIIILIAVFKYMKKHSQQDERMKKYHSQDNEDQSK